MSLCRCGKPLSVHYEWEGFSRDIQIDSRTESIWRYSSVLPSNNVKEQISLGEGWTPLISIGDNVYVKNETVNPTGSFKDRGMAMAVTHISAAVGGTTWMLIEWSNHGKPSVLGIATGSIAGLVAISPAAGFVNPAGALMIGLISAALCFWGAMLVVHHPTFPSWLAWEMLSVVKLRIGQPWS